MVTCLLTLPCTKADHQLNRGLKLCPHAAGRFLATLRTSPETTDPAPPKNMESILSVQKVYGVLRIHQRESTQVQLKVIQMVSHVFLRRHIF